MVKYSIVVRAFNEEKFIGELFKRIYQQTYKEELEVILVDSGSKDKTLEIASKYPVKIVFIKSEEFTFGRALNKGIEAAQGEIMIFASAHVYPVNEKWIEHLVAPFENENTVLSYGKQVGHETITQYAEHQVFKKWFPDESHWAQDHPFCNNANAAIRKSEWQQFPYDESLTGLEDLHWANYMLEKGKNIAYVAEAPIVHIHEERPSQTKNRYRREAIAYKKIFPQATFCFFDFLLLFISNTFADYAHAIKDGVFLKNLIRIPRFRYMQFGGTYQGYKHRGDVTQTLKKRFYYPNKIR